MRKRRLGKTDEMLTMVGFGGILIHGLEQSAANRVVAQAIDRGINYFDVAPTYGDAQQLLGPALEPYRRSIFLACKTEKRTADEAYAELQKSLEDLRTDYLDLYQFHAVGELEEVERIFGPGGAIEAFARAHEQGLIRYIGFSAHTEEAALALLERFEFTSILFPFNWVCWHQGNFGPRVMEKAQEKGLGILALKALARRKLQAGEARQRPNCWYAPAQTFEEASLALRFTLSRPVTAAVSPGDAKLLWWACDIAERFEPLSAEEEAELARRSEGLEPLFPL